MSLFAQYYSFYVLCYDIFESTTFHPCSIASFFSNTTFFFFHTRLFVINPRLPTSNFCEKEHHIAISCNHTTKKEYHITYLSSIKSKCGVLCFCLRNTTYNGFLTLSVGGALSFFLVVWQHFFVVWQHCRISSSPSLKSITRVFRSMSAKFYLFGLTLRCNWEYCFPLS